MRVERGGGDIDGLVTATLFTEFIGVGSVAGHLQQEPLVAVLEEGDVEVCLQVVIGVVSLVLEREVAISGIGYQVGQHIGPGAGDVDLESCISR